MKPSLTLLFLSLITMTLAAVREPSPPSEKATSRLSQIVPPISVLSRSVTFLPAPSISVNGTSRTSHGIPHPVSASSLRISSSTESAHTTGTTSSTSSASIPIVVTTHNVSESVTASSDGSALPSNTSSAPGPSSPSVTAPPSSTSTILTTASDLGGSPAPSNPPNSARVLSMDAKLAVGGIGAVALAVMLV
ncbi:hypothetical protein FB45DRAFT_930146 [Roridomyces roridus]|nr:hypothetical protein FB45DRAFT_930146 [Roridomyces roridus]